MSESVTLTTSQSATIYGTFAAAGSFVATMYGATYSAWLALSADDQKRTLIAATRYLEAQQWDATLAPDFTTRDGIAAFPQASYELAVLILEDSSVLAAADQGTNVRSASAGSARVEFFSPQSVDIGNATLLPAAIMRLVGQYLAASAATASDGALGNPGDCESPFAEDEEYRRWWPY